MTAPAKPACTRCGEPITPGARFCMKCGADVSGVQGAVATALMPAAEPNADELLLEHLRQATLGEYEILKELGRGGMATVYLGHDIALDRKVAIKVMAPALLLMGEGMSERFKREARTAASLSHPNIIPIYTVKSAGKTLFFVMKFIAGRSLEAIMHDTGPMPIPMVRAILQQVGSALGYAHRHGIVHRDVKPANIMIDEEGWAVVTDFGIAKVAENRGLTMTGIAVGTPSYMSPEQCAAKDITGKSDQYSLGIVAYEMLAGRQPFSGDSAMAIMYAHFHEQPPPLEELRPDCPPALAQAVMRMLAKSPEQRFGSMEEAIAGLGAVQLPHDDPTHRELQQLARKGSTREILRTVPPAPTSPVPPAKTREVAEAATTPIPAPRVTGLTLAPRQAEFFAGESLQLTATPEVTGGRTSGSAVTWSSSDPGVASVSASGFVTGHAPGSATITARCEGIEASATLSVRPAPVASVTVEPAAPALVEGQTLQFTAVVTDRLGAKVEGRTVRWSASPRGILEVSGAGLVTAKKDGSAEVSAECEGVRGTAKATVRKVAVASVVVTPADGRVVAGESLALKAEVRGENGETLTDRTVTWRSESEAIATVSADGLVRGVAPGEARVSAECEGKTGSVTVGVAEAPVAAVTIAQPKPLQPGERITLEAILKDRHGHVLTGRTVKWSSSSPAVATVTQAGQLTGMSAGSAKVTAEAEGKSWTVAVTVNPVPVATISLSGVPEKLEAGATATLKVVLKDTKGHVLTDREVTWSVAPANLATITPQGLLTARAAGSLTVTARAGGKSAEARLTIAAPEAPVVPPAPAIAEVATEVMARPAPVEPPAPVPVSSKPAETGTREVAEPRKGGRLVAIVGVLAVLGVGGYFAFRPDPIPPAPAAPTVSTASVSAVELVGGGGPLPVGRTQQLSALLKGPAGEELSGRQVTWTSSDPSVAEVSALGAVTAKKTGRVTITALSEGRSGTVTLEVVAESTDQPAAVASIAISGASSRTVDLGESVQLDASLLDAKGTRLTDRAIVWTTSDPAVVLVSSTGRVTPVGAGTARVLANSEGKSAEARFTVRAPEQPAQPPVTAPTPAPVATLTVAPATASVAEGSTVALTATPFDAARSALTDRSVSWQSSDERIASVNAEGLVTGHSAGTAMITATSEGKSASARLTVTEPPPASVPVAGVSLVAQERTLKVGDRTTWAVIARDQRGRDLGDRGAAWSSSDPKVARVENDGTITGVSAGSAEIAVVVEGKRASERIRVTPPPPPPVAVNPQPSGAGTPTTTPANPPANTPTGGASLLPKRAIQAGGISCGIGANGAVCWGAGNPLIAIEGTTGLTGLTVGRAHACGLLSGGHAVCWGDNRVGQLGDGSTTTSTSAVEVGGGLTFTRLAAGDGHTCGLTATGKVHCWGRNKDGQLGDGSTSDRRRPVAVRGGLTFTAIAAGGAHTCALTAAGKAYCWGDGYSGQLGFGAQETQAEPIDVSGNQKWSRIAAGGKHTCALTDGGKAFCWGSNEFGQVGDGSKTDRARPQAVNGNATFSEVAAGGNHSCGLTTSGELLCWGENKSGQLGDGSKANRDKPTPVGGGLSFTSVSAGEAHTCALTRSGEPVCWGRNDKMQLGDGGTAARGEPAPVVEPRR